jgi:hypothetical protein
MEFLQFTPEIAKKQSLCFDADRIAESHAVAAATRRREFHDAVLEHVRAQGLVEGAQVYHVPRDGKVQRRKITGLQVCSGAQDFEVVVHLEDPDNDYGVLASLYNCHVRKSRNGKYQYVPRKKV